MFRKLTVYTILLSMVLHCGCRLGFLEKLYQKRHQIAYTIGLVAEIPISLCNSNYNFGKHLKINVLADQQSVPHSVIDAREIHLFFISAYHFSPEYGDVIFTDSLMHCNNLYALSIVNSIFHPPTVIA